MKTKISISVGIDPRLLVAAGLWLAQQGVAASGRAAILRLSTELAAQRFLQTSQVSLEDAWALLDRLWPISSSRGNEALFWRPTKERIEEVLSAFERLKERPGELGEVKAQPDEGGQLSLAGGEE